MICREFYYITEYNGWRKSVTKEEYLKLKMLEKLETAKNNKEKEKNDERFDR